MSVVIHQGDALTVLRGMESESVQTCITSPPYFRLRDYQCDGQIGMEDSPQAFLEALWTVFDEVKRVLRPDATLWVNLGDGYGGSYKANQPGPNSSLGHRWRGSADQLERTPGKPKSLLLIPERFAVGMDERGWIVRSRIAWCKTSAMPESVRDRPTSAWEHVWMFSRSRTYYYDAEAVRQALQASSLERGYTYVGRPESGSKALSAPSEVRAKADWRENGYIPNGANLRNFWLLGPEPSRLEHYAGFPTEIPRRCILAGTSERGCCAVDGCGAPWVRTVERIKGREVDGPKSVAMLAAGVRTAGFNGTHGSTLGIGGHAGSGWTEHGSKTTTTGWRPSCAHYDHFYRLMPTARQARRRSQQARSGLWWKRVRKRPGGAAWTTVPCVVLDPFAGSGTTGLVADRLGRSATLIELSPTYAEMARTRIDSDAPMLSETVTVEMPSQLSLLPDHGAPGADEEVAG